MKRHQKLMYVALASACVATNVAAMQGQGGPSYSIKNITGTQIRIEGINTNVPGDLYFSDLTACNETIGFVGGSGYPNLGLVAKHPTSQQVLASTGELAYQNTHIILKQQGDKYSFEVQKK